MKKKGGRKGGAERRSRDPPLAEEGQEYARVVSMLGNGRVKAKFSDGSERACKIRGSMRKREWVHAGDVVLVALRDLAGDKADVIFRYQPQEVQRLRKLGEDVQIAGDDEEANMDELVTFEGGEEDDQLPMQVRRPEMPSDDDDDEDDIDWERI